MLMFKISSLYKLIAHGAVHPKITHFKAQWKAQHPEYPDTIIDRISPTLDTHQNVSLTIEKGSRLEQDLSTTFNVQTENAAKNHITLTLIGLKSDAGPSEINTKSSRRIGGYLEYMYPEINAYQGVKYSEEDRFPLPFYERVIVNNLKLYQDQLIHEHLFPLNVDDAVALIHALSEILDPSLLEKLLPQIYDVLCRTSDLRPSDDMTVHPSLSAAIDVTEMTILYALQKNDAHKAVDSALNFAMTVSFDMTLDQRKDYAITLLMRAHSRLEKEGIPMAQLHLECAHMMEQLLPDAAQFHSPWNMGKAFFNVFKTIDLNPNGVVVEVGPGGKSTIGVGLMLAGFRGTLIVVEPEPNALEDTVMSYQALLPDATIIGIQKPLDEALSQLKEHHIDVSIGNHLIDDMLIGKSMTEPQAEDFFNNHYTYDEVSAKTTAKAWENYASPTNAASRNRVTIETSAELLRLAIHSQTCILTGYESDFFHYNSKQDLPELSIPYIEALNTLDTLANRLTTHPLIDFKRMDLKTTPLLGHPDEWLVVKKESQ